jgi:DNA-binding NarL/FixJ family response regulator
MAVMRTHIGQGASAPQSNQKDRSHTRDGEAPPELPGTERLVVNQTDGHIIIVDERSLVAECMASCLTTMLGAKVAPYASLERWLTAADAPAASLMVFCNGGELQNAGQERERKLLSHVMERVPTVILSDKDDIDQILAAVEAGARGYIPTTLSLDIVVEAIRLVRAGGVYVPADRLLAARRSGEGASLRTQGTPIFTVRQAAVVQALCKGKANKLIAHELNMRESTVKVHVRNIMKKLSAKNRTEVALMASGLPR